jgi:hypothetical protein
MGSRFYGAGSRCGADLEQHGVSTDLERLITAQDPGNKGGIPVVKIIPNGLGQVDFQVAVLDVSDHPVHKLQMDAVVLGEQSILAIGAVVEGGQAAWVAVAVLEGGLRRASRSKRN